MSLYPLIPESEIFPFLVRLSDTPGLGGTTGISQNHLFLTSFMKKCDKFFYNKNLYLSTNKNESSPPEVIETSNLQKHKKIKKMFK